MAVVIHRREFGGPMVMFVIMTVIVIVIVIVIMLVVVLVRGMNGGSSGRVRKGACCQVKTL